MNVVSMLFNFILSFVNVLVFLLIWNVCVVLILCDVMLSVKLCMVGLLICSRLRILCVYIVLKILVEIISMVVSDGMLLILVVMVIVIGVVVDFGVSDVIVWCDVLNSVVMLIVDMIVVSEFVSRLMSSGSVVCCSFDYWWYSGSVSVMVVGLSRKWMNCVFLKYVGYGVCVSVSSMMIIVIVISIGFVSGLKCVCVQMVCVNRYVISVIVRLSNGFVVRQIQIVLSFGKVVIVCFLWCCLCGVGVVVVCV